jgi:hypothetical protein
LSRSHARARRGWLKRFLDVLAETGSVRASTEAAGISRAQVYRRRARHPAFARLWGDSLEEACDLLELEARRRAYEGAAEFVVYRGEPVHVWVDAGGSLVSEGTPGARLVPLVVKRYSDQMLMALLAAHRPEKFGRAVKHEHGHRHTARPPLSDEEFGKLPPDEQLRRFHEALGGPRRN